MSQFKSIQKSDQESEPDVQILKIDSSDKPQISDFKFQKIQPPGATGYQAVKKKFGALAGTDLDHMKRPREASRFHVSPLLREPLSIEEEEKRVIEEKVRSRVSVMAEEARDKAYDEGYPAGLKKGYDEAFQKFLEDGKEKLKNFENFISACESTKVEIFRANERFLVEVIYRVARMVMLKELELDREYVLRLSRELIERVGVRENIKIRVNETDFETAAQLKEGLEKNLGTLTNLNIEVTNLVQAGGCLIETEWNAIDATIETQLKGLYEGLVGTNRS